MPEQGASPRLVDMFSSCFVGRKGASDTMNEFKGSCVHIHKPMCRLCSWQCVRVKPAANAELSPPAKLDAVAVRIHCTLFCCVIN